MKKILLIVALLLSGCDFMPKKVVTEVVKVPVTVEVKVSIPARPQLPVSLLPESISDAELQRAQVSSIASLVGHVKRLECLLVPYATNADQYSADCKKAVVNEAQIRAEIEKAMSITIPPVKIK